MPDDNATKPDPLDIQSCLEHYVSDVAFGLLPAIAVAGHNMGVDLWEHLGVQADNGELRRSIAQGVAMAMTAVAEGRDPYIEPPTLIAFAVRSYLDT